MQTQGHAAKYEAARTEAVRELIRGGSFNDLALRRKVDDLIKLENYVAFGIDRLIKEGDIIVLNDYMLLRHQHFGHLARIIRELVPEGAERLIAQEDEARGRSNSSTQKYLDFANGVQDGLHRSWIRAGGKD
ncbi:MAG: hypothetical protein KGH98_02305 [Candidatus Micrarchaeota archaeon]|nr:hypothetical protein [Candidatus Micrarchaeota archaeon]